MHIYYIPFFIALTHFRFKELGKAIKIKQNILMEEWIASLKKIIAWEIKE